ncbi:MAG: tyrosine-type recombinase/integrase [Deltaproteobacteria bacterium]|nr:tyrosine-type recombinase/integrase [Deltaproteobacteria bacterium]MBI3388719.1 tyrosine-type recombinase/integrase [Deltaproteobacteria bacterium]
MTPIPSDRQLAKAGLNQVPAPIAAAGDRASWRFIEFFTANIRNVNTRRAYGRAVSDFFRWCGEHRVRDLAHITPTVVAAYVEQLQQTHAKPSVKQHLAAVRMLFDWLVTGQVMPVNPAHSVRGPRYVIKRGKTPVLTAEETRELLDAIDTESLSGLRDRALIGVLVYSFARIGAALALKVDDYFPEGKRWKLRLHEKGGKEHVVPVHHTLEEYLDAYLASAGIREEKKGPLFRTFTTALGRPLSLDAMTQPDAWRMIRRRAKHVGIRTKIGCHTFRATGITAYLENGGTLEHAQQIAAHESPRTTKLYDRTSDQITLDEIERIVI